MQNVVKAGEIGFKNFYLQYFCVLIIRNILKTIHGEIRIFERILSVKSARKSKFFELCSPIFRGVKTASSSHK